MIVEVGTTWWVVGYVAWLRQGRPREMPVVLRRGRLIIVEDGTMGMVGWEFTGHFMARGAQVCLSAGSDDTMRLWEYLADKRFATVEWMGVQQWLALRTQRQTQH